jgi:hypothetical protein
VKDSARSEYENLTRRQYMIPPSSSPGPHDFIKLISAMRTDQLAAPPSANYHPNCDCLERLKLLISQELDGLNGAFRKKEIDLISPLMTRYSTLEHKLDRLNLALDKLEHKLHE